MEKGKKRPQKRPQHRRAGVYAGPRSYSFFFFFFFKLLNRWMTTNLDAPNHKFLFSLDVIVDLMRSYQEEDEYGLIDDIVAMENALGIKKTALRFVEAERNRAWEETGARDRLLSKRVPVRLLENSGHWVHVENLPGLLNIIGQEI